MASLKCSRNGWSGLKNHYKHQRGWSVEGLQSRKSTCPMGQNVEHPCGLARTVLPKFEYIEGSLHQYHRGAC